LLVKEQRQWFVMHHIDPSDKLHPKQKPIPLYLPKSEHGKSANFEGGLPNWEGDKNGLYAAVGFPKSHIIYRFNWDHKKAQGTWSYIAMRFHP
jgi:hypothetical protein